MDYFNTQGKITLRKGTVVYHWSDKQISKLTSNLFVCLCNSFWKGKILHKYKLTQDIELILTIGNNIIRDNTLYIGKCRNDDYELLTSMYNEIICPNSYELKKDVELKKNNINFNTFCDKLASYNYNGLFNRINRDKGRFEVVIFNPNKYLKLVKTQLHNTVKLHQMRDCKRIMLSKKILYSYPYDYENINKRIYRGSYPSIFYYIYKKKHATMMQSTKSSTVAIYKPSSIECIVLFCWVLFKIHCSL